MSASAKASEPTNIDYDDYDSSDYYDEPEYDLRIFPNTKKAIIAIRNWAYKQPWVDESTEDSIDLWCKGLISDLDSCIENVTKDPSMVNYYFLAEFVRTGDDMKSSLFTSKIIDFRFKLASALNFTGKPLKYKYELFGLVKRFEQPDNTYDKHHPDLVKHIDAIDVASREEAKKFFCKKETDEA